MKLKYSLILFLMFMNSCDFSDEQNQTSIIESSEEVIENKDIISHQTENNSLNDFFEFRYDFIKTLNSDSITIYNFLDDKINDFPQFLRPNGWKTVDDLKKSLFTIDISGNGHSDILFSGFGGGEANLFKIYQNQIDSFKLIFKDFQYLKNMEIKNNRLKSFRIIDPGCCDANIIFEKFYEIDHGEVLAIRQIKQTALFNLTQKYTTPLADTILFRITQDKYFLRSSPEIMNEPYNEYFQSYGNIIAILKKGDEGKAFGKQTDETGREWWFVELSENVLPDSTLYYGLDEFPTNIKGWLSSRFVETIK